MPGLSSFLAGPVGKGALPPAAVTHRPMGSPQ